MHEAGLEPEIVEYLRTPPTVGKLDPLCRKLGLEPQDIIRFDDEIARSLGLQSDDRRPRQAWLELLAAHPALLQRPILVCGERARIGRPTDALRIFIEELSMEVAGAPSLD